MTAREARGLLDRVRQNLSGSGAPSQSQTLRESEYHDQYEVWIWSLLVDEVAALPVHPPLTVSFRDRTDKLASELVFRTRPTAMTSTRHLYTHALISAGSADLYEAHVGVLFSGVSGVAHEADVSLISCPSARRSRQRGGHPGSADVPVAVEAKLSVSHKQKTLALGHARALLGLAVEVPTHEAVMLVTSMRDASGGKLVRHHLPRGQVHELVGSDPTTEQQLRDAMRGALLSALVAHYASNRITRPDRNG